VFKESFNLAGCRPAGDGLNWEIARSAFSGAEMAEAIFVSPKIDTDSNPINVAPPCCLPLPGS